MSYHVVRVDDLPDAPGPSAHKSEVDEAVGAEEISFNVYVAEPGERIPLGYHHHPEHEELFYVIDGELAFETPEGEFRVGPGEAFFVEPGAPQSSRAAGDAPARVVVAGAPKGRNHATVLETCPECEREVECTLEKTETTAVVSCAECGAEIERYHAGP